MSIENNIIMFDTNIWLKILNENGRMTNRNKIVNEDFLIELENKNIFGIFNISVIEILMRFKRDNNIQKIRNFLSFISRHELWIGTIECVFFDDVTINIKELSKRNDQELFDEIDKLQENRFELKSSIVTLWITSLIEMLFICFVDSDSERNDVIKYCNEKTVDIKQELIRYFKFIEANPQQRCKNLLQIVNTIYKDVFDNFATKFKYNEKYVKVKNMFNKLDSKASISYMYRGVFESAFMEHYKYRIEMMLNNYFDNELFKKIFYQRLKSFMQGEPLQRNDVEDMLMLSTLELYDKLIIVTEDNKMKNFLKENTYDIGNEICEKLIMK